MRVTYPSPSELDDEELPDKLQILDSQSFAVPSYTVIDFSINWENVRVIETDEQYVLELI